MLCELSWQFWQWFILKNNICNNEWNGKAAPISCQLCQVGAVFTCVSRVFYPLTLSEKMIIGGYYVTENHARSAHSQEQHFTAALDGSVQRQGTLFWEFPWCNAVLPGRFSGSTAARKIPLRFAYVILENLKARTYLHLISRFHVRDSAPLSEGESCRDHDRPSPPGRTVFVYSRKIQESI